MLVTILYLTLLETAPLKTVEVPTEYLDYFMRKYDNSLEMVFTREKTRAGANPKSSCKISARNKYT